MFSCRAKRFSCSLDIPPLWRTRDKYIAIFNRKKDKNILSCILFQFWSSKPWMRIHLKCWIWIQWIRIHNTGLEVTVSGSQLSYFVKTIKKNSLYLFKKMRRNYLWHWYFRIYLMMMMMGSGYALKEKEGSVDADPEQWKKGAKLKNLLVRHQ